MLFISQKKHRTEIVAEQRASGSHAVVGGRHEKWGTHNALLYTKNAYIEWLSVEKWEVAQQVDHPLTKLLLHDLEQGDGWGTVCLSVDGIGNSMRKLKIKDSVLRVCSMLKENG